MAQRQWGLWLSLLPLLACLWLGYWMRPNGPGLELSWADRLQMARIQFLGPEPPDPDIVLIGLDEAGLKALAKPPMFWLADFARISQSLLDSGAQAVALDFIFPDYTGALSPALQTELANQREAMLVQLATGKVALGFQPDSDSGPGSHNHPALEQTAAAFDSLCSLALVTDSDGGVRRIQPVLDAGKDQPIPSLAVWLLSKTETTIQWRTSPLRVDQRRVALEGQLLRVSYRTPQRPTRSLADIWRSVQEGRAIDGVGGKVCLIAPTAVSLQDYRTSAYDRLESKRERGGTLGVEHHLAAFDTLRQGWPLVPYPGWLGSACSGLLFVALLWTSYRLPMRTIGWVGLAVFFLHTLVNGLAFVWGSAWLPYWSPLLSGALGLFAGSRWRLFTTEKERRLTRDMFSRMVAPQVVDKVLSDPELRQLGGRQRRVTVLYTDINDFTPICERHTPAEVIVLLNQYFEEMVRITFAHQGMLKQFVGDEIMVIYGAPVEQADHAARAIRTALDMLERLAEMEKAAGGADGFFDIKVGINTGDVVVGHVGSLEHMEYAAVGDDVNLGARIMATTKKLGVSILVSESSKREAEPHLPDVEWISQGLQSFKGKTAQIELFEVRRRRPTHV